MTSTLISAAVRHVRTVEREESDGRLFERLYLLRAMQRRYQLFKQWADHYGLRSVDELPFPIAGATFSAPLEDDLLDGVLGGPDYTLLGTVFCGLQTAITGLEAGDTDAEVADAGAYARVSITNDATNWPAAAAGAKSNGTAITFPTATVAWGTVTHAFISIGGTHDANDVIMFGALAVSKSVDIDDTPEFAIGDFDVTLD